MKNITDGKHIVYPIMNIEQLKKLTDNTDVNLMIKISSDMKSDLTIKGVQFFIIAKDHKVEHVIQLYKKNDAEDNVIGNLFTNTKSELSVKVYKEIENQEEEKELYRKVCSYYFNNQDVKPEIIAKKDCNEREIIDTLIRIGFQEDVSDSNTLTLKENEFEFSNLSVLIF